MRVQLFALAAMFGAFANDALSQSASDAPMMKIFTSSTEIAGLIEKAKSDRKHDQPLVSEPILSLSPYHANLEYRPAGAPAALHERDVEMMYVIEGTGTITTGGKLVDEKRLNAANLTFVTFARMLNDIGGQATVFFVLVVAAAEVVVGLGLIVAIFRRRKGASADDVHILKG